MEAIWVGVALVVAVVGGWPVTAGILKFAKSSTVRAVEAAESGGCPVVTPAPNQPPAPSHPPTAPPVTEQGPAPAGFEVDSTTDATAPEADAPAPVEGKPSGVVPQGDNPPTAAPRTEVLRGGLLIGFLERAAVAVAILSGQPVAIAYVVAIKGLGRYPELKDTPAASERFIIGTLASMLWAASVAVLTKTLVPIG